jgi:hypothetical protein
MVKKSILRKITNLMRKSSSPERAHKISLSVYFNNIRALLKTLSLRLFEILKPEFTIVNEDFKISK